MVTVIGSDGRMTKEAGKFAGLDRMEARRQVVEELKRLGRLQKIEDYTHAVGHCQRCGAMVEPLVSLPVVREDGAVGQACAEGGVRR